MITTCFHREEHLVSITGKTLPNQQSHRLQRRDEAFWCDSEALL